jgi:hypothetical protein
VLCVAEPGSGAFLTPGSRIRIRDGKKPETRSGNQDEHPGSYFLELGIRFVVKILKFIDLVLPTLDPGSGMEKLDPGSKLRPGSATLYPENYLSGGTINFQKFVRLSILSRPQCRFWKLSKKPPENSTYKNMC